MRHCFLKLLPSNVVLADEHIEAIVRGCDRGNSDYLCLALRLREPTWMPATRRQIEDSGHDANTLSDRFRGAQPDGGSEGEAVHISKEAFDQVLSECGVTFG